MTKRALLIGIDTYPDPRNNLNSCVADTVRFQGLLQTYYGFKPQDIAVLRNTAATVVNARTGLTRLFSGIRTGDQVVFFQSSHGYRYVQGTTYTEVLCLYDAFLADTELVQLSGQTPPGTFTCVIDACHSAGLDKLFFAPNGLYAARAKVWQPPLDQAATDIAALSRATAFKGFGRAATSDTGAVAKLFSPGRSAQTVHPRRRAVKGIPNSTVSCSPRAWPTRPPRRAAHPPTTYPHSPGHLARNSTPAEPRSPRASFGTGSCNASKP